MRKNNAIQRLREGKPAVGAGAMLGSTLAAEALSLAGFDWVMIDMQHGDWDDERAMLAFHCICHGSATPMARIQKNDFYTIGRLLDRGALGIIVPMVNTAEEARAAASAMRYPPRGRRSFGPFATAFHGPDYAERMADELFLAVQIETAQGYACAEEILSVEGVDACWIGPNDLGRSMGLDLSTEEGVRAHEKAIADIVNACRRTGKFPGIWACGAARKRIAEGHLFVAVTNDLDLLAGGGRELLRELGRFD